MNRIEGVLRPFVATCVSGVVVYVVGTLLLYGERFSPMDAPLFLWLVISMVLMGAIVELPMLSCLQRRLGDRRPPFLFALIGGLLGPSLAYAIVFTWEKGDAAVVLNPEFRLFFGVFAVAGAVFALVYAAQPRRQARVPS